MGEREDVVARTPAIASHSAVPISISITIHDSASEGATVRFAMAGIAKPRARELALEMLCAHEGAFVLSRALRSTEPIEAAGAAVVAALRAALQRVTCAGRTGRSGRCPWSP